MPDYYSLSSSPAMPDVERYQPLQPACVWCTSSFQEFLLLFSCRSTAPFRLACQISNFIHIDVSLSIYNWLSSNVPWSEKDQRMYHPHLEWWTELIVSVSKSVYPAVFNPQSCLERSISNTYLRVSHETTAFIFLMFCGSLSIQCLQFVCAWHSCTHHTGGFPSNYLIGYFVRIIHDSTMGEISPIK